MLKKIDSSKGLAAGDVLSQDLFWIFKAAEQSHTPTLHSSYFWLKSFLSKRSTLF